MLTPTMVAVGAVVAAVLTAAPAAADPLTITAESAASGSPCGASDLNRTGVTPDGTSVRCVGGVSAPGLNWEIDNAGIQQIGRLQGTGLTVTVTKSGAGQRNCTLTDAAAAQGADAAASTIAVTLNCVG